MKTTIPLSRLAEILASGGETDPIKASEFIRVFFESVEQGLATDGTVSVKDFGTFSVNPDNSVSFQPAPTFSSKVNTAFDAFPAIELDEDIELSEILAPEPVHPQAVTESESISPEEPAKAEIKAEHIPSPASRTEVIDIVPESIPETVIQTEPISEEEDIPAQTTVPQTEPEDEIDASVTTVIEDEYEDYEPRSRRCCTALWIIVAALGGIIAGIFLGYLGRHRIEAFINSSVSTQAEAPAADTANIEQPAIEPVIDTSKVIITEEDIE
ncbi:MAG: hypothetical protein K2K84_08105, partial [Muribaculaceae bacterium]|nr:hypothetical protein [Muribaculaceae bacterium]